MENGIEARVQELNRRGARVEYDPCFLDLQEADRHLAALRAVLERDPPETFWFRLPGKRERVPLPRRQVAYGEEGLAYRFSGMSVPARPWIEPLASLRELLRRRTGFVANFVLVNHYRSGADRMGWHSDDEADLGPEPVLFSLSLGAVRDFQLRPKPRADIAAPRETITLPLAHGSLLVMRHPTNRDWKHQLPRRGGRDPERIGERFNLTWRRIEAAPRRVRG